MFVELKVIGQPGETTERELSAPGGGETTLRALLSALVEDEVAHYAERRAGQRVLRVLTDLEVATAADTGKLTSGGRAMPAPPPLDVAVTRAIEAITDDLVYVFLDGQQLEELDAPIVIGPSSRLRLVRLVALAGG